MPSPVSAEAKAAELRSSRHADDGRLASERAGLGREGDRRRDPRVAISIVDLENPYEEVQLRGRVVERRPDPDLEIMGPVSHKYTAKPFPIRSREGRVALVIELDKERYTKLPFSHTPPRR